MIGNFSNGHIGINEQATGLHNAQLVNIVDRRRADYFAEDGDRVVWRRVNKVCQLLDLNLLAIVLNYVLLISWANLTFIGVTSGFSAARLEATGRADGVEELRKRHPQEA